MPRASLVVIAIALLSAGAVRAEKLAIGATRTFSGGVNMRTRAAAIPFLTLKDWKRVTVALTRTGPTTLKTTTTLHDGIAPGRDYVSSAEGEIVDESASPNGEHMLFAKFNGPGYVKEVKVAAAIIAGRIGKRATVLDADGQTRFVFRASGGASFSSDSNTWVQLGNGSGLLSRWLRAHVVAYANGELDEVMAR